LCYTRQGFNTGVVLYRLDRMRKSKLYNSYLTSAKVKELVDK
jgi:lipopolysaccharide biosynthesis glycosyltransferase